MLCIEFLAEELLAFRNFVVPLGQLFRSQKLDYPLTNLVAVRLHLGNNVGSGCARIVLQVIPDLFPRFRQSGGKLFLLLVG